MLRDLLNLGFLKPGGDSTTKRTTEDHSKQERLSKQANDVGSSTTLSLQANGPGKGD
jgi:hypothetical protein